MTKLYAGAAAVAVAALLGGSWWVTFGRASDDPFAQCRESAVSGGAGSIGGPFELVNTEGETVTDEDVITKPTLLYFGYTFCPDICPADAARNAEATDMLQEDGYDVQPAFISIDPERDTPEVVGDFVAWMHDDMIGLTGSPEQVKAASQAYRTFYRKQEGGDPDYYLVDHSTFTYLVFPEEGFVEFFRHDEPAEEVVERAACFIDAAG
ncbi:SCO family protein [Psychromarinibacter sp. C21-152]|uniref:SCO family protein n=1 Tax=Psychromarinibacter sediminicola TaxID=3033385 RepID=A0AAE3NUH8_9RHOB|nr:SCO family protein [Psychromarinibacter sediminicola]MDF0602337.1 SCO family protein [Psychromarinibacter sediminicola]